jgi:Mannosylglycerate hydrolase MGH1-like glycoside hydrolase domain/Glycosyl hydrolase family 65, C-terminal domain
MNSFRLRCQSGYCHPERSPAAQDKVEGSAIAFRLRHSRKKRLRNLAVIALVLILARFHFTVAAQEAASNRNFAVLHPNDYHHYVLQFATDEQEVTHQQPPDEWPWIDANIPLFDSSNKQFEEMYYFRWYSFEKHIEQTPDHGYLITEWGHRPDLPFNGVLPDAAQFHLNEARWLRDPQIADDYARFWISPGARPRNYSFALATSVRDVALATGDTKLETSMLSGLIANHDAWRATQLDPSVGLYWSIDTRDAMEKSISGDGYRPTLNSYMVGDARAIATIAQLANDSAAASKYSTEAGTLEHLIETKLWNPKDQFYEVLSPAADSGIRKEKRFKDNGTTLKFAGVRELIGYIPWEYYTPTPSHNVAWKQLFDPRGFAGKFGPTTAERRSPRFRFTSSDQCTWNGPSWPYATTQTLLSLADLLNGPAQPFVGSRQYYQLFSNYVLSQHLKLPDGRVIDWIDEDLDADTDEWIAKDMLIQKHKQVGRGNYYNHSGFADPLISGLIGLRPRADNRIFIHPLLPAGAWTYFAIDGLPYHGHLLAIVYDETGKHYNLGRGLTLFVDGKKIAGRPNLGLLEADLPTGGSMSLQLHESGTK